jgi:hypothetical protein
MHCRIAATAAKTAPLLFAENGTPPSQTWPIRNSATGGTFTRFRDANR